MSDQQDLTENDLIIIPDDLPQVSEPVINETIMKPEDIMSSSSESLFDFWISNSTENNDVITQEPVVKIEETQNIVEEDLLKEDEDLNNIIDWTISKLDWRKTKIWWKKQQNLDKIEILKQQIKNLEEEKSRYENENNKLDQEAKKIWLNIVNLEKMKLNWETIEQENEVKKSEKKEPMVKKVKLA